MLMEPEKAQTIAVFLHELATNAAKNGALSAADGHVHVAWSGFCK
jgi:two-component sensor histidine kinase